MTRGSRGLRASALSVALVFCVACATAPAFEEGAPPAGAPQPETPVVAPSVSASLGEAPDPFAAPSVSASLGEAPDPFAAPAGGVSLGEAPDPFAAPAGGVSLGEAPDPFAAPSPAPLVSASPPGAPGFAAAAVDPRGDPPGFEVHGRGNLSGAFTRSGESVELLEGDSLNLSSVDVYLQWFPVHWFGAMVEGELDSELDDRERRVEPELELAIFELRPLGDPRVRLRLGHAPVPFGLERRYYAPPRNELINRPAAFRRVYPGTYSDVGAFLWIDWPLRLGGARAELELALTKGLDGPARADKPDPFRKDRDGVPQLSGRVALTLFEVTPTPGLGVAFPARLTLGASLLAGQYDAPSHRRIRFYGLDAELQLGGLRVRAEGIWSEIEREQAGVSAQRGIGVYALVAYHWYPEVFLIEELYLALRYGRADADQALREDDDVETYHLGGGWSPYRGVLAKAGFQVGHGARKTERVAFLELGYSF